MPLRSNDISGFNPNMSLDIEHVADFFWSRFWFADAKVWRATASGCGAKYARKKGNRPMSKPIIHFTF